MLNVEGLKAGYGRSEVIQNLSLRVDAGEAVAVIGPNGAGKTTLLNALMGLNAQASGALTWNGRALGPGTAQRLRAGMALVPERRELFGGLSVIDNLRLGAYLRRHQARSALKADVDFVFGLFPVLRERQSQMAQTLSGGEQQMLAIGRALMSRPRLLLLDEPSTGLAPRITLQILQALDALRASQGLAVLLVEQNARLALRFSGRAYVLEMGDVVLDGPSSELARDPRVIDSYLGSGATHA
ncbi:ABC transporter ATP-binding protein [Hydrogenophaga sp. YM1]|jgi:branched-chain amino acid transport system ATP-binding protein|uniref:ABC transporter ATP-binding protein n=1 Tax=Hydrogenophaga sp. YM1 TaxID=2806262 RepID=UPI00195CEA32|nr:ABC transporter ATP-binding protein [Hydrogenophaga sp. YM1]QRR36312.1 ABC transporter ATP-binding protein [Hydrogenophaga sp. YM1]